MLAIFVIIPIITYVNSFSFTYKNLLFILPTPINNLLQRVNRFGFVGFYFGEYKMEEGQILVVTEEGIIAEIKEEQEAEEEKKEEEKKEEET